MSQCYRVLKKLMESKLLLVVFDSQFRAIRRERVWVPIDLTGHIQMLCCLVFFGRLMQIQNDIVSAPTIEVSSVGNGGSITIFKSNNEKYSLESPGSSGIMIDFVSRTIKYNSQTERSSFLRSLLQFFSTTRKKKMMKKKNGNHEVRDTRLCYIRNYM